MTIAWGYPEDEASFPTPGSFTACIAGSATATRSAAAWIIRNNKGDEPEIEDVRVSDSRSTAPRSALAAAARVLKALAPGSSVDMYCRQEYVVNVINSYRQKWTKESRKGWINLSGKAAVNQDIINRIDSVIRTRELKVTAYHCSNKLSSYGMEISRLLDKAAETIRASDRNDAKKKAIP